MDAPYFPTSPFHSTPTSLRAFITLSVSMGYAHMHISSLINLFLYFKISLIVYLAFKFNKVSCILSGTPTEAPGR